MTNQLFRMSCVAVLFVTTTSIVHGDDDAKPLAVGVAEQDITPPIGFPMAGYYHERLADGMIDPLSNIVISATHSHTAPDYMKELWLNLGKQEQEKLRAEYIEKLINGPADAIAKANKAVALVSLRAGAARQETPVSFNRRFVMRDGSVRTWMNYSNPDVIRAAGPIDPEIGLLVIGDAEGGKPRGVLSNFALHLDTVGGTKWSADYPHFIERTLRAAVGPDLISTFAIGCCGDINHVDPSRTERNKADFIGRSIGESIIEQLDKLKPITATKLFVKSQTVRLPLQDATAEEVSRSVQVVETIYIPHRAAYAGGSYEVTNSAVEPGAGEILVEAALTLLREAASSSLSQGTDRK